MRIEELKNSVSAFFVRRRRDRDELNGALDELHQSLVPGRSAELGDWLADAVGVALGSFAFSRYE